MSDWLSQLKVGDDVVVDSTGMAGTRLDRVARFTKTQIVLNNNGKFRRDSGRAVGDHGYHGSWLVEPTQELRDKINHTAFVRKFRHFDWDSLSLDALRAVNDAITFH